MRLLFVTTDFPPEIGGTQTYAFELAKRFASLVDDLVVVAPYRDGALRVDASLPFDVVRINASPDTMVVRALPTILRLTKQRLLDTSFHVQWSTAAAGLAARRYSSIEKVCIAAHGRELLLQPLPGRTSSLLYDALRRAILRRADALFPVSRYTAGLLRRMGVRDAQMKVIPGGVDVERFKPMDTSALRKELGLRDERVVLSVSRLVQRKGIDDVIRALPRLIKRIPNLRYFIGGAGPDRERLEELVRSCHVGDVVRFLGRIPDPQLPAFYNLCDVFAMPSRSRPPDVEGFGLVFLEAAACGKPALGTYEGGIPDAVLDRQTGILVEGGRTGALADELSELLLDEARLHSYGRNARLRVQSRNTWDVSARALIKGIHQSHSSPTPARPAWADIEISAPKTRASRRVEERRA